MTLDRRDPDDVADVLKALPPGERNPTFSAPWEAEAFAIAVALHRRGVFTWSEWAQALGAAIKAAQASGDPDLGDSYYRHWLAALEQLLERKGVTDAGTLGHYREAWRCAAERTPHGTPIELAPQDLAHASGAR